MEMVSFCSLIKLVFVVVKLGWTLIFLSIPVSRCDGGINTTPNPRTRHTSAQWFFSHGSRLESSTGIFVSRKKTHPHIQHGMSHAPSFQFPSHLRTTSLFHLHPYPTIYPTIFAVPFTRRYSLRRSIECVFRPSGWTALVYKIRVVFSTIVCCVGHGSSFLQLAMRHIFLKREKHSGPRISWTPSLLPFLRCGTLLLWSLCVVYGTPNKGQRSDRRLPGLSITVVRVSVVITADKSWFHVYALCSQSFCFFSVFVSCCIGIVQSVVGNKTSCGRKAANASVSISTSISEK